MMKELGGAWVPIEQYRPRLYGAFTARELNKDRVLEV